jgi:hypothetical protein
MRDFWILLLVKVHRWTGRKLREEMLRNLRRTIEANKKLHLN